MSKQFGGLKLISTAKTGFTAVYDMINSPTSTVTLLTYNSLKGFMFILNVDESDSEYLTLSSGKFTKRVTSFILKFAVITPINDTKLTIYKNLIEKSSESRSSYFEEAKLQQTIWKSSIRAGRPEICPPVANFSLFDNNNSKDLINFFLNKTNGDAAATDIFNYLFTEINVNVNYEIGVIVMPNVENSTTFGKFIDASLGAVFNGIPLTSQNKEMAYAYVSAQIVRLFIAIGVIHFDLHMGNALIYLASDKTIKSVIIDFGRASNIMTDIDDDYLMVSEKLDIQEEKTALFNKFFTLINKSDTDKINFILSILTYIAALDKKKNQAIFQYGNSQSYQMDWYENYPTTVPLLAFNLLNAMIISDSSEKMTDRTIKIYENQGVFVKFSRNILEFVVPFTGSASATSATSSAPTQDCDGGSWCSIMGGRKYKKSKKQRKTKKRKTKQRKSKKYIRYNKKNGI